ncbi:hypothetical protein Q4519_14790 [Motilimonas sp. 1_MG-2023]|uniref:hypothetical protein n=1 Tax=Motilimonas sp. 1_MG-2023 TaxID=3062672 RepID=UPI0026E23A4A|nr:hypothetical protein [Motilimonas sp. 1_MG-2023]MDO6526951.1 hypothetical protein [Motilimonas sp. 1_MG-2023]
MDLISVALASYINTVQNTVHKQMNDIYGVEAKTLVLDYAGMQVPFTYQLWKVQDKSVCATYAQNALQYSKCTVAASDMFHQICRELKQKDQPSQAWQYTKYKNMYCNAALAYKPMVAQISFVEPSSELRKAEKACNVAILEAMGSDDEALQQEQKRLCNRYRKLDKAIN